MGLPDNGRAFYSSDIIMQRVLVIGSPGAGKSTFALKLGKKINLPVIHLDKEFWNPGWIETPSDQWRDKVRELVKQSQWIIDGSYDGSLDIRLPRADTVIFLDFPRYLCLWRVLKRIFTNPGKVRFDMAEGCPEKIDFGFFRWIWNYRRNHYPKIYEKLNEYHNSIDLIFIKSPAEVQKFIRDSIP
jgi:adenylate kinase family enzyme